MKDVKLIAADMDHTLLTEKGELPPNFSQYVRELNELGVDFAIASGRPHYTLEQTFFDLVNELIFISDNGGIIHYKGETIFKSLISVAEYRELVDFVDTKTDGVPIICGLDSAYLFKKHQEHDPIIRRSHSNITFVDDLRTVDSDADKFTIYFPNKDSASNYEQIFNPKFGDDYSVTIGDSIWVDIMNKGIDKGEAMRILGEKLQIDYSQMMAFGDTYNDIQMLKAVKYSYLVENASEDMKQFAKYMTKSNDEYGVLKTLDELIKVKKSRD